MNYDAEIAALKARIDALEDELSGLIPPLTKGVIFHAN